MGMSMCMFAGCTLMIAAAKDCNLICSSFDSSSLIFAFFVQRL